MAGLYVFAPAALDRRDVGSELLAVDDASLTLRRRGARDAERREARWPDGGAPPEAAAGVIVEVSQRAVTLDDGSVLPNPPAAGPLHRLRLAAKAAAPLLHESPFAPGHELSATLQAATAPSSQATHAFPAMARLTARWPRRCRGRRRAPTWS